MSNGPKHGAHKSPIRNQSDRRRLGRGHSGSAPTEGSHRRATAMKTHRPKIATTSGKTGTSRETRSRSHRKIPLP